MATLTARGRFGARGFTVKTRGQPHENAAGTSRLSFETDAFILDEQLIWGATARILEHLLERSEHFSIAPPSYEFIPLRPLSPDGAGTPTEAAPLRPRAIVVLDVVGAQELVQDEPPMCGALADPAVGDHCSPFKTPLPAVRAR